MKKQITCPTTAAFCLRDDKHGSGPSRRETESLRRCIDRIADKTPSSVDQLLRDPDIQDIIALNLQRAVQLSVDIASHLIAETDAVPPSTMAENFAIL